MASISDLKFKLIPVRTSSLRNSHSRSEHNALLNRSTSLPSLPFYLLRAPTPPRPRDRESDDREESVPSMVEANKHQTFSLTKISPLEIGHSGPSLPVLSRADRERRATLKSVSRRIDDLFHAQQDFQEGLTKQSRRHKKDETEALRGEHRARETLGRVERMDLDARHANIQTELRRVKNKLIELQARKARKADDMNGDVLEPRDSSEMKPEPSKTGQTGMDAAPQPSGSKRHVAVHRKSRSMSSIEVPPQEIERLQLAVAPHHHRRRRSTGMIAQGRNRERSGQRNPSYHVEAAIAEESDRMMSQLHVLRRSKRRQLSLELSRRHQEEWAKHVEQDASLLMKLSFYRQQGAISSQIHELSV